MVVRPILIEEATAVASVIVLPDAVPGHVHVPDHAVDGHRLDHAVGPTAGLIATTAARAEALASPTQSLVPRAKAQARVQVARNRRVPPVLVPVLSRPAEGASSSPHR